MHSGEAVSQLDAELVALARREGALRLRLGQALEVLGRGACFALGFSSLSAYVLERCERSVRWAESARALARRLEALPALRGALASGMLSWSKGEILGGAAMPGTESAWLEAAQGCTVRELRALVAALQPAGGGEGEEARLEVGPEAEGEARCTLGCTVDREEAWLFEATRHLLEQLGARSTEEQVEALLAEAQATLLAALPRDAFALPSLAEANEAQRRWRVELARYREQAELVCEARLRDAEANENASAQLNERSGGKPSESALAQPRETASAQPGEVGVAEGAARGLVAFEAWAASDLDDEVRALCRALASHEFELSRRLLEFHREDGWRRLGYATESQHARERLGMSRSSVLARRSLALRLEQLPALAAALGDGCIGVEVAIQLVRIATRETERAWLEHARRRTLKHLREEVAAALVAVRVSGERDCFPPAERAIEEFHELERAVVSGAIGALFGGAAGANEDGANEAGANEEAASGIEAANDVLGANGDDGTNEVDGVNDGGAMDDVNSCTNGDGAWRVMLESLRRWLAGGVQMSAGVRRGGTPRAESAGRVELRLRISRELYDWWRALEACARRWLPRSVSFVRFLCLAMWRAHGHLLGADVAYGRIYARDRCRCTSPVCNRRDVTPHHVRFRSQGGSDDDANVIAVCAWCHLLGIHGGRIRATGAAHHVRWELGERGAPCVVVDGRQRVAA